MASIGSKLFVNLAYQKEGNKYVVDDPDAFRIPRLTFTLGGSFDLAESHSIGGSLSYIGSRQNLNAYTIANINYTARLSNIDIFVIVRNLFDENILNPNNSSQNSTLVAPGEGITFQLGVRVHF